MTVYCRLDRSPIRQKPKFYTLLTYFSELCEKTPFGEISLENFLTLPNNSQNGGNYSSAQRRIYFFECIQKISCLINKGKSKFFLYQFLLAFLTIF
jgi:hypothetical protein